MVYVGTWENQSIPRSLGGAEEAMKRYDTLVVGLSRSRGVDRVMPVDSIKETRRGQQFNE